MITHRFLITETCAQFPVVSNEIRGGLSSSGARFHRSYFVFPENYYSAIAPYSSLWVAEKCFWWGSRSLHPRPVSWTFRLWPAIASSQGTEVTFKNFTQWYTTSRCWNNCQGVICYPIPSDITFCMPSGSSLDCVNHPGKLSRLKMQHGLRGFFKEEIQVSWSYLSSTYSYRKRSQYSAISVSRKWDCNTR